MKKLLIVMLGAMVALTSCLKSDLDGISNGGEVTVTLSASMSGAGSTTRADYTPGDGTTVDRCILEVYIQGGSLYKRMETSVTDALTATFDLRLVSSQSYEFLLWADKEGETTYSDGLYITNNEAGLKGITTSYDEYVGNNEERDAFYDAIEMEITNSTVINAELTRPFGQVNVKTYLTDVPADMYPASVSVLYTTKVYNTFNVLDGTLSGDETAIEWYEAAPVMDGETGTDDEVVTKYIDLSTEYLFAPADEQNLHKFAMTFYDASGTEITTNENFVNIPVQRNYRTNISGELLTKQGSVNVEITPDFTDPDSSVSIEEVASVEEANSVIAEASDDVSIKIAETVEGDDNVIVLPDVVAESSVSSVTIDFSDLAANTEITVGGEDEAYDGTVNIIVSSEQQAETINVNTPDAHVTFYGTAGEIIVWVSDTTFVVEAGATIETLTINKGNVLIYGTVNTIDQQGTGTVYYCPTPGDSITDVQSKIAEGVDAIYLSNGTYSGDLTLSSDCIIIGESQDAIITGQLTISKYSLNISNVTIENTAYGIYSNGGASLYAENVIFNVTPNSSNNNTAVMQWKNDGVNPSTTIKDCVFNTEGARAIQLRSATVASVTGCTFNAPYSYAVQVDEAGTDLTFSGNTVNSCQLGVFVYGGTGNNVTAEDNTFESVYFPYAAKPAAKNDATSTLKADDATTNFWYYLVESDGISSVYDKPYETIALAGSFSSQIAISYRNNNQTFISLNHGVNPNTADSYKTSWAISGAVKFAYDSGNNFIEGVTLDGLYFDRTFINQQYGGLKDVTIQNCVFNGTMNNWSCGYIVHQGSHDYTDGYTIKNNLFKITDDTTSPRLMLWGNSTSYDGIGVNSGETKHVSNVVVEGNVMEAGYIDISCANMENFDVTVKNNVITAPTPDEDNKYLYAAIISNASEDSRVSFENNTINGGAFSTFYLSSGIFTDSNLVCTNNVTNNTTYVYGASGENFDKGDVDYSAYSQNVELYYFYEVMYNEALTSSLGDWNITDSDLEKGYTAPMFADGVTTVYAKSSSFFGQDISNIYTNTEWMGDWYQTLDFYIDDEWAAGDCFNFVTNPTGSNGTFPKCNQILSMLKAEDGTFSAKLSVGTGCSSSTNYDTSKNGDNYQAKTGLALAEGWYTIKMRYYYDEEDGNYKCTATLLQTDNSYIKVTCEFTQVNKTGEAIGMESIMYFDADSIDTNANHPAIKIANQKVFLEID